MLGSDGLDELLLVEILDEGSGDGSSNLELLADDRSGDAKDLWQLLEHSLVLLVVKEDSVVKLLLNLDFGPGLLLGLGSLSLRGLGVLRRTLRCVLRGCLCFLSLQSTS